MTSCRYVCSNEGVGAKRQTEHVRKCFRAETRTDCKARMVIILDREIGNYEVTNVVLEHNHLLHIPEAFHLMRSQRKISELQAFEIETADDSVILNLMIAFSSIYAPLIIGTCCQIVMNIISQK